MSLPDNVMTKEEVFGDKHSIHIAQEIIFRGTKGPRDAKVMIIGDCWSKNDEKEGHAFAGEGGKFLQSALEAAGLKYNECLKTNLIAQRPARGDMGAFFYNVIEVKADSNIRLNPYRNLYPKENLINGLKRLYQQIELVKPEIIIGLGSYVLWALTEECCTFSTKKPKWAKAGRKEPAGIGNWRGSQMYTDLVEHPDMRIKLVPTYHPSQALRNFEWSFITKHDIKTRVQVGKITWEEPEVEFLIRPSYEEAHQALDEILDRLESTQKKVPISVDIETRFGQIACIGFALSSTHAVCIPIQCTERSAGYWTLDEELHLRKLMRDIQMHPMAFIIGQNYIFDAQYFALEDFIQIDIGFDTMLMQHVCWPGMLKGLDFISSLYCKFYRYWKGEGKHWNPKVPEEQLWGYNCKDAVNTFEVYEVVLQLIKDLGLEEQASWQMRQVPMVLKMMIRGTLMNMKARKDVQWELMECITQRQVWLQDHLPRSVHVTKKGSKPWYGSPKQQCEIFYDKLHVKPIKSRKSGNPTCDDEALERIAMREPLLIPIIVKLQELRSASVFYNTFATAKIDPDDRMRCSFNIAGTETFRWSSAENAFGRGTNLQNIPVGNE